MVVILMLSLTNDEGKETMEMNSQALKTDHYELTMLEAALASGVAHHRSVFEVFARRLPPGRRYGVVGGIGRIIEAIKDFRFGPDEISYLRSQGFLNEETLNYLENYKFSGTLSAYREGDLYFPFSPILTVESTFAEGVLLETIILSIINADSAVASAASRMVLAAEGSPLIEMGSRRTHDEAAVSSARMATALGFSATSNLEAGRRWGAPTRGTSAHAFTLAHVALFSDTNEAERAAFKAQVEALGVSTTLLIDTFDIPTGIQNAVEIAGTELGGIRIDSGDLSVEAFKARAQLDAMGAFKTKIVVSGDLDEYSISELKAQGAPIDVFGVGTRLVVGSGHPTASFVYKLVSIADSLEDSAKMRPVAKKSSSKVSLGGKKQAFRQLQGGVMVAEVMVAGGSVPSEVAGRALQATFIEDGDILIDETLDSIRATHQRAIAELPSWAKDMGAGEAAFASTEEIMEEAK